MAKTLAQIEKQIAALRREADVIRKKEVGGVIARIKEAITHYGLTPLDLFVGQKGKAVRKAAGPRAGKAAAKVPSPPKYRDEAGNTWTGRGKRPRWFKAAIEAGKTPADLEIKG